ncbi:histidine kinase [Streptomyces pathocidini]|uniref:sensor histidine kinase n=1 Tax=Streptomyces pathocidini TaxID=1650571 RepID=UPI0034033D4B
MRLPRSLPRKLPSRLPRSLPRPRSLAGQLFAMQVVLVAAVVAGCAVFAYVTARQQAEDAAGHQVTAAARAIADSPSVRDAIREAAQDIRGGAGTQDVRGGEGAQDVRDGHGAQDVRNGGRAQGVRDGKAVGDGRGGEGAAGPRTPSAALQPYAEQVRRDTGVAFVTIMSPSGIRWTHPHPGRIGEEFLGHRAEALKGRTFTETYTGTLGPSVRVVTPIRAEADGRGPIVGLVSAGITVERISAQVRSRLVAPLGVAAGALVLGGIGTYVVNARLRRHTHGMNAAELSRMHDYHQAALHAVREGLLMLDGQRRIALINDGGRELLGLGADAVGREVAGLGLPAPLTGALLAAGPRVDEVHLTADRIVVVNTSPVSGGERRGTLVTLRDHTELQALSGELDSVRGVTEALRSQAHEAANRLHTVVSLIELGRSEEAVEFATAELELAQVLTDRVVGAVAEPVLAALLLGKAAQANERGAELILTPDSRIDDGVLPEALPARDLVTVLGNLIDNAVDAAAVDAAAEGWVGARGDGWASRPADAQAAVGAGLTDDDRDARRGHDHANGRARARARGHGRVTVTARADQGELLLRVADTGPGVDAEAMEAVFQRGWSTKTARAPETAVPGQGREPGSTAGCGPSPAKDGPRRGTDAAGPGVERGTAAARQGLEQGPTAAGPGQGRQPVTTGSGLPRGRGLGLALVRQAVRRNGGTIALGQSADGGAEFTVRLPIREGGGALPTQERGAAFGTAGGAAEVGA